MQLYRNLFICASVLTISAILTHGLATGLPYWIYRIVPGVKHGNKTADVLAYEGLFKACIEYDDVVIRHVKKCINSEYFWSKIKETTFFFFLVLKMFVLVLTVIY